MPLSTYAELQTEIAGNLNRDDLSTQAKTFIALGEAQMNRDIRHWRMEKRATANADSEYIDLPDDWAETIRVHLTGSGTSPLQLVSRDAMADMRAAGDDVGGTPIYYTHSDGQIQLYPTPSATTEVELLYYARIQALSDSNTSNWLLTYAPDVYLYGSLLHSAPWLQEDARLAVWAQLYSAAVTQLNDESEAARNSGTGLRMKIRGMG